MNTQDATRQVEHMLASKTTADASVWGMLGGSATSFFGWLGSQDVVAGVGAVAVVVSLIINYWHKKSIQRIEVAKLTPEQREFYRGSK